MKKMLLTILSFVSISMAQNIKNCEILSELFDQCVNSTEIQTCRDKGIALYYSLHQAKIDEKTSKEILKLCIFYCTNPSLWDKQAYFKACLSGFKEQKGLTPLR